MDSSMDLALLTYVKGELDKDEMRQFMMVYPSRQKNASTGVLLSLFLGGFGAHQFWLGHTGLGFVYLLCGTIGWFLIFPPILLAIVCIIDAFAMKNYVKTSNTSAGRHLVQELITLR